MKKLPRPLVFEWDQFNIAKNYDKHGVTNKEAEEIFFNKPIKIFKDIKHSSEVEDRFVVLGLTNGKVKLHVAFTIRNDKIRVISARNQSKRERRLYEEK